MKRAWGVRALVGAIVAVVWAQSAVAQEPPAADDRTAFKILDNSFLVEESFNQEAGVFQNIFTWMHGHHGDWQAAFTQEWPLGGMTHQFSYTLPFSRFSGAAGVNDALLNYRYQLTTEAPGRPAISPRLSLVLATGSESDGLGGGGAGLQINIPASKQFGDLYVHVNAGGTWIHGAEWTTQIGGSGIWRTAPMFHLMLEAVGVPGESATISPGFRGGWNVGHKQIVIGAALPVTRAGGQSTVGFLTYFSYELPFR